MRKCSLFQNIILLPDTATLLLLTMGAVRFMLLTKRSDPVIMRVRHLCAFAGRSHTPLYLAQTHQSHSSKPVTEIVSPFHHGL